MNCCWRRGRCRRRAACAAPGSRLADSTALSSSEVSTGYWRRNSPIALTIRGLFSRAPARRARADLASGAAVSALSQAAAVPRRLLAGLASRSPIAVNRVLPAAAGPGEDLLRFAQPVGVGDPGLDGPEPTVRRRLVRSTLAICSVTVVSSASSLASSADAALSFAVLVLELSDPVDHGLPVDVSELAGLVQARRALARACSRRPVLLDDALGLRERALLPPGA